MRIVTALLLALLASANIGLAIAQPGGIADNAPDRYTVQKGDTLWGISGRFLKQPTRWPEVWRINRESVRNPHLIYPGQVIVLDRATGTLSIAGSELGRAGDSLAIGPRVYSTPVDTPIASVPFDVILPFLTEPLVYEQPDGPNAPIVVAIQEERVVAGAGDTIFAKNIPAGVDAWQLYRRSSPIKDPDTQQILAYEAGYVGTARVTTPVKAGEATAMLITMSKQETNVSDRLQPWVKAENFNYPPRAPAEGVTGKIVAIYGGVGTGGRFSVVTLGIGKQNSVEPGHVFALYRNRGDVVYRDDGKPELHKLPENRYGTVFVFRVFNRVSYALVMDAALPVRPGDTLRAP